MTCYPYNTNYQGYFRAYNPAIRNNLRLELSRQFFSKKRCRINLQVDDRLGANSHPSKAAVRKMGRMHFASYLERFKDVKVEKAARKCTSKCGNFPRRSAVRFEYLLVRAGASWESGGCVSDRKAT